MRTFKLITRFYSGIFLANFLVTLSCMGLVVIFGKSAHLIFALLFWFKVVAMGLILYLSLYYRQQELYYYQNLGISKLKLAIATSGFDILLFVILLIITSHSA